MVKRKEAEEDYTYSAIFEFEGGDHKDTVPLTLTGRGICPKIKINKAMLQFGECQVNDHKESLFYIENIHNTPLDVSIPRIPGFSVDPPSSNLHPGVK